MNNNPSYESGSESGVNKKGEGGYLLGLGALCGNYLSSDGAFMLENEAKFGLSLGGNIDMSLKATASFFYNTFGVLQ